MKRACFGKTLFVLTHFSHNGKATCDELVPLDVFSEHDGTGRQEESEQAFCLDTKGQGDCMVDDVQGRMDPAGRSTDGGVRCLKNLGGVAQPKQTSHSSQRWEYTKPGSMVEG